MVLNTEFICDFLFSSYEIKTTKLSICACDECFLISFIRRRFACTTMDDDTFVFSLPLYLFNVAVVVAIVVLLFWCLSCYAF